MATKKKTTAAEPEQVPELKEDAVLPEGLEEEAPEVPVLPEEMGQEDDQLLEDGEELPKLAYYRVNWPGGVRLRVGPGLDTASRPPSRAARWFWARMWRTCCGRT